MSRIGKQPVVVPGGVKVAVADGQVSIEGPVGKLAWKYRPEMTVKYDEAAKQITVARKDDSRSDQVSPLRHLFCPVPHWPG